MSDATDLQCSFGRKYLKNINKKKTMMKYVLLFVAVFAALAHGLPSPKDDGMSRYRPNMDISFYVPEPFCAYKCAVTCNRLAMMGSCIDAMCSCYQSFVPEMQIFA